MMLIVANGGDTLEGITTILRERRCPLARECQRNAKKRAEKMKQQTSQRGIAATN